MKEPWRLIHTICRKPNHSGYLRERIRSIYWSIIGAPETQDAYFGKHLYKGALGFRLRERKRRLSPRQTLVGTFEKKLPHWNPKSYLARFQGVNAVFSPTKSYTTPIGRNFFWFLTFWPFLGHTSL